ncbi:MAG TPA: hypothetical protein VMF69_08275 [Gemmataceae bacterium]|nr:hypothetical protein [Gemmataceae bacterium]
MLRKVIAASLVLVLSVGVIFAEEFQAAITKVEGNKVSFFKMEGKGKDAKKVGDETTMPVAKDVKVVVRGKKGEDPTPLEDGLKNKRFTNIGDNGVRALIVTEDKKITEIRLFGRGGKGKKQ